MSAFWPLPDDIDATFPDTSAGDKLHQQHHDAIHEALNAEVDPSTGLMGLAGRFAPLDAGRSGTGPPEGVVTAPVGTVYRDTAATNGATLWVKASGIGNTGWRVVYSDTGWRQVGGVVTAGVRTSALPGNFVEAPDRPELRVTDKFSLTALVDIPDWQSTQRWILGKYRADTGLRGYALRVSHTGNIQLSLSLNGNILDLTITQPGPGKSFDRPVWIGVTYDGTSNGERRAKFFTSFDGVNWTKEGADTTGAQFSAHPTTASVQINGVNDATIEPSDFTVYSAQIYDGVGANTAPGQGTLVADWRANAHFAGNNRSVDSAGNVWTIRGSGWSWDTGGALAPGPQAGTWHGNGFPESVVTAPVGTRYTDLDATNGAVEWIKATGTGNTGWRVVYGDTGWRVISSWNAEGVVTGEPLKAASWAPGAGQSGGIWIRRTNHMVSVAIRELERLNTTETQVHDDFSFPSGMLPDNTTSINSISIAMGSNGPMGFRVDRFGNLSRGDGTTQGADGRVSFVMFSYPVRPTSTWVDALPGVPM